MLSHTKPVTFLCLCSSGLDKLGCEVNGVRLEEGQVFQQSCAQLCRCLGGGLSCVPLCSDDLQVPPEATCPSARLVRLPGRCCKEWVCNSLDNSISSNPSASNEADYLKKKIIDISAALKDGHCMQVTGVEWLMQDLGCCDGIYRLQHH